MVFQHDRQEPQSNFEKQSHIYIYIYIYNIYRYTVNRYIYIYNIYRYIYIYMFFLSFEKQAGPGHS